MSNESRTLAEPSEWFDKNQKITLLLKAGYSTGIVEYETYSYDRHGDIEDTYHHKVYQVFKDGAPFYSDEDLKHIGRTCREEYIEPIGMGLIDKTFNEIIKSKIFDLFLSLVVKEETNSPVSYLELEDE